MKVSAVQMKMALSMLGEEIIKSIEPELQRGLVAAQLVDKMEQIGKAVDAMSVDGQVETSDIRKKVDAFFKYNDGKVSIPIEFNLFGFQIAKPIDLNVTKEDADKFFDITLPSLGRNA